MKSLFLLLLAPLLCLARPPLMEANRGQFPSGVQYGVRGSVSALISPNGVDFYAGHERISATFVGGSAGRCVPGGPAVSEVNYLNKGPKLARIPAFTVVVCQSVYAGIDWAIHNSPEDNPEFDWIVQSGADPGLIRIDAGAATVAIKPDGALILHSGALGVTWKQPTAWQIAEDGSRVIVPVVWQVSGGSIGLSVNGYRHDLPLTIDPVVEGTHAVTGSGFDRALQVGVDGVGNVYLTGTTTSPDFQTTPGAVFTQTRVSDARNLFIRKLSPDLKTVIYSTYMGIDQSFTNPTAVRVRVDMQGNVYIAGNDSTVYKLAAAGDHLVYPTLGPSEFITLPGSAPGLAVDQQGFAYIATGVPLKITKRDPTGKTVSSYPVPSLLNVVLYGIGAMAIGADGGIFLAGSTSDGNFRATSGALKTSVPPNGYSHGFLIRMNPDASAPVYSTWVGGDGEDTVQCLAVDATGAAYVGGSTKDTLEGKALSGAAAGGVVPGDSKAFVMKVNPGGIAAVYTTFVRGDQVQELSLDGDGSVLALSYDRSVLAASLSRLDPSGRKLVQGWSVPLAGDNPVLLTQLAMANSSDGSVYVAATSLSNTLPETNWAFESHDNAFVVRLARDVPSADIAVRLLAGPEKIAAFQNVNLRLEIRNNGATDATDLVLATLSRTLQGGTVSSCRVEGPGLCGNDQFHPRVTINRLGAGASVVVDMTVSTFFPAQDLLFTAFVNSSTADPDFSNNYATVSVPNNGVQVAITGLNRSYFTAAGSRWGAPAALYVVPGSDLQVYWPPQQISLNAYVFDSWTDNSLENPRTFRNIQSATSATVRMKQLTSLLLEPAGVVSAASYSGGGVSPGEMIALFGFNIFGLNKGALTTAAVANNGFPGSLAGVSVTFDGVPAPLIYTSGTQVGAVVPYEVAGKATTVIRLQSGSDSVVAQVPVVPTTPALFTSGATGSGAAAALNQNGTVNSGSNPAHAGEVITLFGTGEGLVNPVPANGSLSISSLPVPVNKVSVTIGGEDAEVLYAAAAPYLTAGVIQINARIPGGIRNHTAVPVIWSAAGKRSQTGVTISVK